MINFLQIAVAAVSLHMAVLPVAAEESAEGRAVFDCYLQAAVAFEPYQDNMRDLAEVLVGSVCFQKRQAFLESTGSNNPNGLDAFNERMLNELIAMILAARSSRLGIEYEN